jgi:hypothetical protein
VNIPASQWRLVIGRSVSESEAVCLTSRSCVHDIGMSIDRYGAGPNQSLENPLGMGGVALHEWAFRTRAFHRVPGKEGGTTDAGDDFVARGFGGH